MLIAAIDAGSPLTVGWATNQVEKGSGELGTPIAHIMAAVRSREQVALGVEAPLWVPIRRSFTDMTKSRGGVEASARRPWSAGAGPTVMAAGLANLAYVLEAVMAEVGPVEITTQVDAFQAARSSFFIWEAFVSGEGKPRGGGHADDALCAVDAFVSQWPELDPLLPRRPAINLACAVANATGHPVQQDEARLAVPVIGPAAAGAPARRLDPADPTADLSTTFRQP